MPATVGFRPSLAQVPGDYRRKFENPATDRFVADQQSALSQEILDVPIAQCEAEVEPDGMPDDIRRKSMAGVGNGFHDPKLSHSIVRRSLTCQCRIKSLK